MSPIEQAEIRARARGMTLEEKWLFLKEMPSSMLHKELYTRDQEQEYRLTRIASVLNGEE